MAAAIGGAKREPVEDTQLDRLEADLRIVRDLQDQPTKLEDRLADLQELPRLAIVQREVTADTTLALAQATTGSPLASTTYAYNYWVAQ